MKRAVSIVLSLVLCFSFGGVVSFAQEGNEENSPQVFLSMTKYADDLEKLPTNVKIISQETIKESHASDLTQLLEYEAGIVVSPNGTKGDMESVFIRGAASVGRTLVLIDGRRINNASTGGATTLGLIPLSIVERIEIIRGSGAAIYGTGAFGGVINIITKKATALSPLFEIDLSNIGSDNTFNPQLSIPLYAENFSAFFAYSKYLTNGYRDYSRYDDDSVFSNIAININKNQTLSISANKFNADYQYPGDNLPSQYGPNNGESSKDNYYLKADYDISLEDKDITLSVYHSEDKNKNKTYGSLTTDRTLGAQIDFRWIITKEFGLIIGGEYINENYIGNPGLDYMGLPSPNLEKDRNNAAIFTQLDAVFGNLRLLPTIRYDNNSVYGDIMSPALSAIFDINENLKVSANTGKVWRAPSFEQLYDVYGYGMNNPDLKPEDGWSSDLGLEWFNSNIKVAGTFFYIQGDNLIVNDELFVPHNIGKSNQYGFEFETGYIMFSWLSHKLNYTFLKTEDEGKKKELPYAPPHSVNYSLSLKPIKPLSFTAVVHYRDAYFGNANNDIRMNTPKIITCDLSLNYDISPAFSLWAKVLNVGDLNYQIVNGYPMQRRAAYMGISVKFLR